MRLSTPSLQVVLTAALTLFSLPLGTSASKLLPTSPPGFPTTDLYGGKDATILQYPADWARGILPKPIHCHNCYWQDSFVFTALAYGARSIESDVWLLNGELYVGHDPTELTKERTFSRTTVSALETAIDQANAINKPSSFFRPLQEPLLGYLSRGFFSLGVGATAPILLLIDIKNDGDKAWPLVVEQLEPLRKKGYLTSYDHGNLLPGAITVIGTGGTPLSQIAPRGERDVFLDCPLGSLDQKQDVDGVKYEYNSTLCGIASMDLPTLAPSWKGLTREPTDAAEKKALQDAIKQAHDLAIETRVYETPEWPKYASDNVNQYLLSIGSDWINADDLEHVASKF